MSLRWIVAFLLLSFPLLAHADTVELVTYYPAPGGGNVDTDRLHASRETIGDTYSLMNPTDANLPDGTLLVADSVGIGTGFGAGPPGGVLHAVGANDALDRVLFMPGADTGAAGTPEIRVGIGTANPATGLEAASVSTVQPRGILSSQYNNGTHAAQFIGAKARGTPVLPTAAANGDNLLGLIPAAYDGTDFQQTGWLGYVVNGTVAAGSVPSDFVLHTGTSNQGTEKLRVTSGGNVGIGIATPQATAPNGIATGNLDVNDLYLRSLNAWTSQIHGVAKMRQTVSQSAIPVSSGTVANFTVVEIDTEGMANVNTDSFTIPANGIYEISCGWGQVPPSDSTWNRDGCLWVGIRIDGVIRAWFRGEADPGSGGHAAGSEVFSLSANSQVQMLLWQNISTGAINTQIDEGWKQARMSVRRVR